jgi:hypothetical protein
MQPTTHLASILEFVMGDIVSMFFGTCLVSYAVAVVMPTWRWLLGTTLVVGLLLSAGPTRHWIIESFPNSGPVGGIGAVLLFVATASFAAGVLVRGLSLLLGSRGLRWRYVVIICIAGAVITPAIIIVAPDALTSISPWSR